MSGRVLPEQLTMADDCAVSAHFNLAQNVGACSCTSRAHNGQIRAQIARMHIYMARCFRRTRSDNNGPLIFARYRDDARVQK